MSYPPVSITTAADELNRLHSEIEGKMRSTVQDAIRAGEILTHIKNGAGLRHGDFLPWIKANCRFSERTARNYMGIYEYRDKTASVADLQEAYKQIETLEAAAKREEYQRKLELIRERDRTGKKPDGWDRSVDYEAKRQQAAAEFQSRVDAAAKKQEHVERIEPAPERDWSAETNRAMANFEKVTDAIVKRQGFKEKIRLSHEGKDDPFVDAIMDYLESLSDDNRRVEACYNIIKVCKRIAIELGAKA